MMALGACGLYIAFTITFLPIYAYAGWTPAVRVSEPGRYLYPSVKAHGDTLHVVADYDAGDDLARYYRSLDGGDEWSPAFIIPDPQMTDGCVLPTLTSDGNNIYTSWKNIDYIGPRYQNIGFRRSTDGGSTWLSPVLVLSQDRIGVGVHTLGVADSILYVIYTEYLDSELHFLIAKSFDQGETWSYPDTLFGMDHISGRGIETSAVDDTIHVVWTGSFSETTPSQVYYFRSTDGGETWSDNVALRNTEDRGAPMASIAVNERGDMAACWMDYRYAPSGFRGDIFCRLSFDGGDSWDDEIQLTFVHESMGPDVHWLADDIYVAYIDWRFDRREIWFRRSSDNGQTWGDEERLTDDYIEDRDPSVAAVEDGRIYVVYSKIISNPDSAEYAGVYFKRCEETVGISDHTQDIPMSVDFLSAYPNPFNSTTSITYNHLEGGEIEIYNITGQKIRTLNIPTKEGKIIWDATDAMGNKVSSGIYFARAKTHNNYAAIKLLYMK